VSRNLESLRPGACAARAARRRLTLRGEFRLALRPTLTALGVLGLTAALVLLARSALWLLARYGRRGE
jgi:hypothetical protein